MKKFETLKKFIRNFEKNNYKNLKNILRNFSKYFIKLFKVFRKTGKTNILEILKKKFFNGYFTRFCKTF